jgi:hypothetical protein
VIGFSRLGIQLPDSTIGALCDALTAIHNAGQGLFAAIQYSNGRRPEDRRPSGLPNYRGYYSCAGTDRNQKRDKDAAGTDRCRRRAGRRQCGSPKVSLPQGQDGRHRRNRSYPTAEADNAPAPLVREVAEWDGAQAPGVFGRPLRDAPDQRLYSLLHQARERMNRSEEIDRVSCGTT